MKNKIYIFSIIILVVIICILSFLIYTMQNSYSYIIARQDYKEIENSENSAVSTVLYVFKNNKCILQSATMTFDDDKSYNDTYQSLLEANTDFNNISPENRMLQFKLFDSLECDKNEIKDFLKNNWTIIEI